VENICSHNLMDKINENSGTVPAIIKFVLPELWSRRERKCATAEPRDKWTSTSILRLQNEGENVAIFRTINLKNETIYMYKIKQYFSFFKNILMVFHNFSFKFILWWWMRICWPTVHISVYTWQCWILTVIDIVLRGPLFF